MAELTMVSVGWVDWFESPRWRYYDAWQFNGKSWKRVDTEGPVLLKDRQATELYITMREANWEATLVREFTWTGKAWAITKQG